jgi:hypothetical protein
VIGQNSRSQISGVTIALERSNPGVRIFEENYKSQGTDLCLGVVVDYQLVQAILETPTIPFSAYRQGIECKNIGL